MVVAPKTESVQWVDGLHGNELGWEEGYGVFSVSKAQAPSVLALLEDQERHHVRRSYTYELLRLINGHDEETTSPHGDIFAQSAASLPTSITTR